MKAIQERYNVPEGYTDYREMILKEKPDIVSIATRPATHAKSRFLRRRMESKVSTAKAALLLDGRGGRNVGSVRKARRQVQLRHQRRYMPIFQKMRELIDQGELGEIQAVIGHVGVGAAQWGAHTYL